MENSGLTPSLKSMTRLFSMTFSSRLSEPRIIELSSVDLPDPVFPMAITMSSRSAKSISLNAYYNAIRMFFKLNSAVLRVSRVFNSPTLVSSSASSSISFNSY